MRQISLLLGVLLCATCSISGQENVTESVFDFSSKKVMVKKKEKLNESPYAMFGDKTPVLKTQHEKNLDHSLKIPLLEDNKQVGIFELNYQTSQATITNSDGVVTFNQVLTPDQLGRFLSVDPLAEKYYSWSPYVYCLNNPLVNVDFRGDSVTHLGSTADLQAVDAVHNQQLGGYYTVATNPTTGLTSMTAVTGTDPTKMTKEQQNYHTALNTVVNGAGMTTINVVNNSTTDFIGTYVTTTIDIGDIYALPQNASPITQGSALMHETWEQYENQVLGTSPAQSHINATIKESTALGMGVSPLRSINLVPSLSVHGGFDYSRNEGNMIVRSSMGNIIVSVRNNNIVRVGAVYK